MPRFDFNQLTEKDYRDIYDASFEGKLFKRLDKVIKLLEAKNGRR